VTVAAVHQPQYVPYLGFFDKVAKADVLVALDSVQFHRRGLQHRNKIKSSQGWQWFTVPVLHESDQLLRDVAINPTEPWQRKHANAVRWNYGKAPYFETYSDELIRIIERPWEQLVALDMALTRWVMDCLGITTPIVHSSELGVGGSSSELLADLCVAVGADTYLSGPGGRRYMDLQVFQDRGVGVLWQEFEHPSYPQLFPDVGFIPDLSIIDTLLCCGRETASLLGASA